MVLPKLRVFLLVFISMGLIYPAHSLPQSVESLRQESELSSLDRLNDLGEFSLRTDEPGGSMWNIPVRCQVTGTCASHVAVDLIDAWRMANHGDSRRSAHMEAAIGSVANRHQLSFLNRAKNEINRRIDRYMAPHRLPYEGNQVEFVVEYLRKNGSCNAKHLPRERHYMGEIAQDVALLFKIFDEYSELRSNRRDTISGAGAIETAKEVLSRNRQESLQQLPNSEPLEELLVHSSDSISFVSHVISRSCLDRISLHGLPQLVKKSIATQEDLRDALVTHFLDAQGPILPMAISYCAQATVVEPGTVLTRRIPVIGKIPGQLCGLHVALITGLRNRSGKLEVLIRNSFGYDDTYNVNQDRYDVDTREMDIVDLKIADREFPHPYEREWDKDFIDDQVRQGLVSIVGGPKKRVFPTGSVWMPVEHMAPNSFEVFYWAN